LLNIVDLIITLLSLTTGHYVGGTRRIKAEAQEQLQLPKQAGRPGKVSNQEDATDADSLLKMLLVAAYAAGSCSYTADPGCRHMSACAGRLLAMRLMEAILICLLWL